MQQIQKLLEKYPIILQLLRFIAIGLINTALDFAVLNFISKTLGITSGFKLGGVNTIGFSLAVIQSFIWNKYWAFSTEDKVGLLKNFTRLVSVGFLGGVVLLAIIIGSRFQVSNLFYLGSLALLILGQIGIWFGEGIGKGDAEIKASTQFVSFIVVSLIGLIINSVLVAVLSSGVSTVNIPGLNPELAKNIAKIIATLASLVWNFLGYKLFVFKR